MSEENPEELSKVEQLIKLVNEFQFDSKLKICDDGDDSIASQLSKAE